jgi:hypothetical protein
MRFKTLPALLLALAPISARSAMAPLRLPTSEGCALILPGALPEIKVTPMYLPGAIVDAVMLPRPLPAAVTPSVVPMPLPAAIVPVAVPAVSALPVTPAAALHALRDVSHERMPSRVDAEMMFDGKRESARETALPSARFF